MRQTYRRYGFLVSALVHLGLLGGVAWLLLAGMSPGPRDAEHEVPVALSMFAPAERAAPEAQSPADSVASPAAPTPATEQPAQPKPPEPLPSTPAEPSPEPEPAEAVVSPVPAEPAPKIESPPPAAPERPARASAPREHAPTEPKPVAKADNAAAAAGPTSAKPKRTDPSAAQAATGTGEAGEAERERLRDIVRAGYLARLQAAIARHKYYPRLSRRRGEEGRVLLRLVIGSDGDFSEVRVARSSGKRRLDAAALKTIERLGHAEPLPPELGLSAWRISVPMVFSLK